MTILSAALRCAGVLCAVVAAWSVEARSLPPAAASVPSRITSTVNEADRVRLTGNTHPLATPERDRGLVDPALRLDRMVLVLQRSAEQAQALAALNERQHDPFSSDYHHWLDAPEFGRRYGPSDADVATVGGWLKRHGFTVLHVNEGKVSLEFSGTAGQVQEAFHVQLHHYLVAGVMHLANDRDPEIPRALAGVVNGITSLHDFLPKSGVVQGGFVKRNLATGRTTDFEAGASHGVQPDLGYLGNDGRQHEDLTPYDFATIYNVLPLWQATTPITGSGVKVAIAAGSDIVLGDIATFRKAFGLPAKVPTVVHNGTPAGLQSDQLENTLDVEMAGAAAPGADVTLVVSAPSATTWGFELSMQYIVSKQTAPIMSVSYTQCELDLQQSGNTFFHDVEQQGATEGISIFVAAGDAGSAGCDYDQSTPDEQGFAVSGMASTPYVTAVGGTDFTWSYSRTAVSTYWNPTADANGATAKGYIPEAPWNSTCANPLLLGVFVAANGTRQYASSEAMCNQASQSAGTAGLTGIEAGGGGVSSLYDKPSWQAGAGVPADGKRDLPDVSLFASTWGSGGVNGSAILFCMAREGTNSCDYSDPSTVVFQEVGGTSAASPYLAGVMALVLQKTGVKQGLANPVFYRLAAQDVLSSCGSASIKSGSACVFQDTTTGTIAQPCVTGGPSCATDVVGNRFGILRGYSATVGYDPATGLGSVNVANLVNGWAAVAATPTANVSPASLRFPSTPLGATSAAQMVTIRNTAGVAFSLTAGGITLSGPNASSFSESATSCAASMAVGASCTIEVAFKPAALGSLAAVLSVADSATGSPQSVALTGTGAAGSSNPPTASGGGKLVVSSTSLAFATTAAGVASAAQTVTLKNPGTSALTLKSFTLTGQADDFVLTKSCGAALNPGASCVLSLRFKPVSAGAKTGGLSIIDSGTPAKVNLSLKGTGR